MVVLSIGKAMFSPPVKLGDLVDSDLGRDHMRNSLILTKASMLNTISFLLVHINHREAAAVTVLEVV